MKNPLKDGVGSDQILIAASYLYLVLPILIFLFGWLMLPFALIAAAILLVGAYLTLRDFGYVGDYGVLNLQFLFFSLLILFAWVLLSGIGGFGLQNWDFLGRNAIFRDLIDRRWPVIYDYSAEPVMKAIFGNTGALVYYFHFWLPSALVGKLLGWKAANATLFIWTLLGVFLCIVLIARYVGRARIVLVLAFVFWSGLDVLGAILVNGRTFQSGVAPGAAYSASTYLGHVLAFILGSSHLETWITDSLPYSFNYNSFTTQLFWVFNSSIPAWLVTLLCLNLKGLRSILFTFVLVLFFSPLSGLGLIPFLVYVVAREEWPPMAAGQSRVAAFLKELFRRLDSFQDTVVVLLLVLLVGSFYGTQVGNAPHGFIWEFYPVDLQMVLAFLAFIFLEFLAFGLFTLGVRENRPLLLMTMIWLSLIPLYQYGFANDFGLKASVPPLIILFTVGFKNILEKWETGASLRDQWIKVLLVAVLLISAVTPLHEMLRSRDAIVQAGGFPGYFEPGGTFGNSDAPNPSAYQEKMRDIRQYVIADPNSTWFFRFLAPH